MEKIRFFHSRLKKISFRLTFFFQYYVKKTFYLLKKRTPQLKRVHFNSFPAVHMRRMDFFDFAMKFSSELLVVVIAVAAATLNIYYFHGANQTGYSYSDQSFAAAFLNKHVGLNPKLAEKNNVIITTVAGSSFIASAQAEDFIGSTAQSLPTEDAGDSSLLLNEDGITKPNPDSVQGLVEKQVKIYQTQAGDTLRSIAAANGISQQTIKWANNLSSDQIKPGWYLLIPPVDGVIAKADSNTTLPDLAAKYNPERYNSNKKVRDDAAAKLLDTIISYNGLADAEDIDAGQIIIIPGGAVTSAPQPAPQPKPKATPKSKLDDGDQYVAPSEEDVGTGHIFPWGYCTYYVASKVHVPWGGNAKNWPANAKAYGAVVSKEAAAGAIVVTSENRRYGHVALVEQVTDDAILVSEMNYKGKGIVDQRWISKASSVIRAYIYH